MHHTCLRRHPLVPAFQRSWSLVRLPLLLRKALSHHPSCFARHLLPQCADITANAGLEWQAGRTSSGHVVLPAFLSAAGRGRSHLLPCTCQPVCLGRPKRLDLLAEAVAVAQAGRALAVAQAVCSWSGHFPVLPVSTATSRHDQLEVVHCRNEQRSAMLFWVAPNGS